MSHQSQHTLHPAKDLQHIGDMLQCGSMFADDVLRRYTHENSPVLIGVSKIVHIVSDYTPIISGTHSPSHRKPDYKQVFWWAIEEGRLSFSDLHHALWASYIMCLDATISAGTNPRAHIPYPDILPLAKVTLDRLGITPLPWKCVYASQGTFWEGTRLLYDPHHETLGCEMLIGS